MLLNNAQKKKNLWIPPGRIGLSSNTSDIHEMPISNFGQEIQEVSMIFLTTYGFNHTLKYVMTTSSPLFPNYCICSAE
jgi:hypothetical protein